jgi:hypothetical protein
MSRQVLNVGTIVVISNLPLVKFGASKKVWYKNFGVLVIFRGFAGGKHAYVEISKGEYL